MVKRDALDIDVCYFNARGTAANERENILQTLLFIYGSSLSVMVEQGYSKQLCLVYIDICFRFFRTFCRSIGLGMCARKKNRHSEE